MSDGNRSALESEIQYLPGVGPRRAALLKSELGVGTFGDLLRLYPFRYVDRSSITPISEIRPDMADVQIRAAVIRTEVIGGKRLSVTIADRSGEMEAVFFKGIKWVSEKLKTGREFIFFGKPTNFNGRINIVHPDIDPVPDAQGMEQTGGSINGVYSSTEKLRNGGITAKVMNRLQEAVLRAALPEVKESLPEYILKE